MIIIDCLCSILIHCDISDFTNLYINKEMLLICRKLFHHKKLWVDKLKYDTLPLIIPKKLTLATMMHTFMRYYKQMILRI
jgi:hypothetical protein